jgi:hypothetical protein
MVALAHPGEVGGLGSILAGLVLRRGGSCLPLMPTMSVWGGETFPPSSNRSTSSLAGQAPGLDAGAASLSRNARTVPFTGVRRDEGPLKKRAPCYPSST